MRMRILRITLLHTSKNGTPQWIRCASLLKKNWMERVFSESEISFLKRMLSQEFMCGGVYDGWYPDLFYNRWDYEEGLLKKDYLVADYHTAPTDAAGNFVGWVAHAGTGPVEMAILNASLPSGKNIAFIGPVSSYYEYTTTNFLRLTDEEWKESYLDKALRPDWTRIYMADTEGRMNNAGPSLMTSTGEQPTPPPTVPESYLTATNYPNPFNNGTLIHYNIPDNLAHNNTKLAIYNVQGKLINILVDRALPSGNYFTRWNGIDSNGTPVATGIYFYTLTSGSARYVGKMRLIK